MQVQRIQEYTIFYVLRNYLSSVNKNIKSRLDTIQKEKGITVSDHEFRIIKDTYDFLLKDVDFNKIENDKFYLCKSIFSKIKDKHHDVKVMYNPPKPLHLDKESIMPTLDSTFKSREDFERYWGEFLQEFKISHKPEQMYYICNKYAYNLPAVNSPDCQISLFNVVKLTTALTICKLKGDKLMLIKGDISGIQDFIFSIPSKGAAKALKGRSFYITLLSDVICRFVLKELELDQCNLLYNGGGNFYILAPSNSCDMFKLNEIRKIISEKLLDFHKGKIYMAFGFYIFDEEQLDNIGEVWRKAGENVNQLKSRKWYEIGLKENYNKIFGPVESATAESGVCRICGASRMGIQDNRLLEDREICYLCNSFNELTDSLKKANYLIISEVEKRSDKVRDYIDLFASFGFKYQFADSKSKKTGTSFGLNPDENCYSYTINNTDFIEKDCNGFIFKSVRLPEGTFMDIVKNKYPDDISSSSIEENLKEINLGDNKLGVVKLDVDNLGKIFINGLGDENNIANIIDLSRALSLFFEGFIYKLMCLNKREKGIYLLYAGGDDTFFLGAYNQVFEFLNEIRRSFHEYACENLNVTFSAGTDVYPVKTPVAKFSSSIEGRLNKAKDNKDKNSICFMGEVFRWNEYEKIIQIKDICSRIVYLSDSRSVLNKVLNSTKGLKSVLVVSTEKESSHRILRKLKLHRLFYYLRELKNHKNPELNNLVEELVSVYENIVFENLFSKENQLAINPMIIPSAVRWAILNTRKERDESNE
ncbi:MAG: type III-A CRISPR-associated protein Cas10/Csm1 [Fibrobacter sp.]|nr:type III-A CRISPR-associated protein Cas10/Csm1 [Fibrobacter sp.]